MRLVHDRGGFGRGGRIQEVGQGAMIGRDLGMFVQVSLHEGRGGLRIADMQDVRSDLGGDGVGHGSGLHDDAPFSSSVVCKEEAEYDMAGSRRAGMKSAP